MHWLMHERNRHLVDDELVGLRLGIYLRPESRVVLPRLNQIIENHDDNLIPLDKLTSCLLFLLTLDNPIQDMAAVKAPGSIL